MPSFPLGNLFWELDCISQVPDLPFISTELGKCDSRADLLWLVVIRLREIRHCMGCCLSGCLSSWVGQEPSEAGAAMGEVLH